MFCCLGHSLQWPWTRNTGIRGRWAWPTRNKFDRIRWSRHLANVDNLRWLDLMSKGFSAILYQGHGISSTIFGGIKQCKCMVITCNVWVGNVMTFSKMFLEHFSSHGHCMGVWFKTVKDASVINMFDIFCRAYWGLQFDIYIIVYIYIYNIYIYLEPKWPLFWLEKTLFWRLQPKIEDKQVPGIYIFKLDQLNNSNIPFNGNNVST